MIDGGTGTELEARGVPMNGAVWCGVEVPDYEDVVREDNIAQRSVLVCRVADPHSAEGVPDPQSDPDCVLSCFREQVAVQAEGGVDLVTLEMIPSAPYGRPAAQAAAESCLPLARYQRR